MSVADRRAKARAVWGASLALAALAAVLSAAPQARADYTDGIIAQQKISKEAAIRIWRKSAWQHDDFLSQIKLGDIYGEERGENKYFDPIESYVWYYLASVSDRGLSYVDDWRARRVISNNFARAMDRQLRLILLLNAEQREEARNRIIYILSCRGPDGYIKLGQLHSSGADAAIAESELQSGSRVTYDGLSNIWRSRDAFRTSSEKAYLGGDAARARTMMGITTSSVIIPNDGEALTYFYLASNMGHPIGREYVRTLDQRLRRHHRLGPRIAIEAAERAKYWSPPYEFYPPGHSESGVPYTDECYLTIDQQKALLFASAIPQHDILYALKFLGWGNAVSRYQASLLDEPTGRLTASQRVRVVQSAALRGDANSQNALGVMYAKGYGVTKNFVRAEYWFRRAGDQRYAASLYHLGVLYKVGPEGIRQDLSKSNDYMTASALAGFRPTMNQLHDLIVRAENEPRRPGQH
ncbi:MAG: tetratricopeptide repeat protein [Alphaproteobacteria bacterium]